MEAKLPPMFARVVVAEALPDAAARARFYGHLRELDESGLVAVVLRQVRVERGVWLREGHSWPEPVQAAVKHALQRSEALEGVMHELLAVKLSRGIVPMAAAMESRALNYLQRLMDAVFLDGTVERGKDSELLAGIGGFWNEAPQLHAASGLEAAGRLAWCVRSALLGGVSDPLRPYVVTAAARRAMRKQVGRERPGSSAELLADDVAILRAVQRGPLTAKEVEKACKGSGARCSLSHVTKRKRDLTKWGLLTRSRQFELSATGRAWLREIEQAQSATHAT